MSLSLAQLLLLQGGTASNALARGHTAPESGPAAAVGDTFSHPAGDRINPGTSNTPVAQLSVPAGNYVTHVNVDFQNATSGTDLLSCQLEDTSFSFISATHFLSSSSFSSGTLSFTTVMSLNSSAIVVLYCNVISPDVNKVTFGEMTMIRIGTIQRQQ